MATQHNFRIKNGLEVAGTVRITSAGLVTGTTTTQAASDNTTKLASTAYVTTALANLVDGAPSTLNTLNEIATSLANDTALSASLTTSIAAKLPLAGGTLTGDVATSGSIIFDNNVQAIKIKDAAGTAGYAFYLDNADTLVIGNGTIVEKIRLDTSGNEGAITIDTNGKVGVGGAASFTFQVRSPSSTAYNSYNFLTSPNVAFSNATSGAGHYNSLLFGTESNGEVAIGSVQNSSNNASDFVVAIRSGGSRLERMRIKSDGTVGIQTADPFSRLQSGSHTFSGGQGMYGNSRVGISNHGSLTGMMLASTYNDASHPEYGLVFVQGPTTANYNVWSISPDGPAKGNGLNFHYGSGVTNIHQPANHKISFKGNGYVGIGTDTPLSKLHVASGIGRNAGGTARFGKNAGHGIFVHSDASSSSHYNWMITTQDTVDKGFEIIPSTAAGNTEFSNPAFVIKADTGRVGIGETGPDALLHIKGTGDAIRVESTNTGNGGAQVDLLHYTTSPADGDIPGSINFGGYYSGTSSAYSAAIRSVWSNAGGREGQLQFLTRQSGSQFDTQLTINHQGHAHLGHDKSSVQFYVGNQGGIMGGNSSHNIRGAGNLFMLNAGGTNGVYQFEANGAARLNIANDGVTIASAAPSGDSYTHKFRTSNSADPGLLVYREGQTGFGIAVRSASTDYATFSLAASAGQNTTYDTESGDTNMIMRMYHNKDIHFPASMAHNVTDGVQIIGSTGRIFHTFNYNSAGAEVFLQNNRTSGTVAAFQYRINNSAQSGGTIYAATNGYTGGNFSDYRLKNNVVNLTGSLDKINALRVVSYNHVDSPDLTELGVIAHEIKEVFPEFVRGEKDAVWSQRDIDHYEGELPNVVAGDIKAQQVDYFSKEWTSHFIKAIQELKAENDALKARITTLEG